MAFLAPEKGTTGILLRRRLTSRDNFYEWQYLRSGQINGESKRVRSRQFRTGCMEIFATVLIRIYGIIWIKLSENSAAANIENYDFSEDRAINLSRDDRIPRVNFFTMTWLVNIMPLNKIAITCYRRANESKLINLSF